jgi:uncharacterized protein (TIGR03437 family)
VTTTLTTSPIILGSGDEAVLELYGTGIRGLGSSKAVTCTIGGIAAGVLYAGAQGQFPGLDQVNVSLPLTLAGAGEVAINLSVEGQAANTVTVVVR